MSLDPVSLSSFRDEVEKIAGIASGAKKVMKAVADRREAAAFAKKVARRPGEGRLANWTRTGWEDVGRGGGRGGWMGKPGTFREKLPIGGKALTVGFTGMALPGAMSKQDPMGRERSRLERLSQLGAGTLGGLAGVGAVLKPGGKTGFLRMMAGGMGGAIGAEHLSSLPFRRARQQRVQGGPLSRQDRSSLMAGRGLPEEQQAPRRAMMAGGAR